MSDEATVLRDSERENEFPSRSTPQNIKVRIVFASTTVAVALGLAWVWYTGRITQFTKLGRPVSVNVAHNSEGRQDSIKADEQDANATGEDFAASPTPSPTLDIHEVNFRNVKVPLRGSGLTQQDVGFDKVEFGDLDGDGSDEAAVLIDFSYARTGGNGYGNFGYIYSIKDGKLKVVSVVKGGFGIWGGMIASAKIQDSRFVVKRCDRSENYSYVETTTYRLDRSALVLVNRNAKETDDCPTPRIKNNSK